MRRGGGSLEAWIGDGEKYALIGLNAALIGLNAKAEERIPFEEVRPGFWVATETTLNLPPHWREWLGSLRAEEVQNSGFFLLSKSPSPRPDVLDAENDELKKRVWHFYVGLLLVSTFALSHNTVLLTGSRQGGEIGVRSQQDLDPPIPCLFRPYPAISAKDVKLAAHLAEGIAALETAPLEGGHWRFFRTLGSTRKPARSGIFPSGFINTVVVLMV